MHIWPTEGKMALLQNLLEASEPSAIIQYSALRTNAVSPVASKLNMQTGTKLKSAMCSENQLMPLCALSH